MDQSGIQFQYFQALKSSRGYNIFPNRLDLDQAVIYLERVPDTVQTDHIDWGFRAGEPDS